MRAAKEFLQDANPEAWQQVKAEFVEELFLKARTISETGDVTFKPEAVRKRIAQDFGREFMSELMGNEKDFGRLMKAFDMSEQLRKTIMAGTDDELEKAARSAVQATSQFISAKINTAWALMNFGLSNNRLLKLIDKRGIDEFLTGVPNKDVGRIRQVLSDAISYAKAEGKLAALSAREVGRSAIAIEGGQEIDQNLNEATRELLERIGTPPAL